MFRFKHNPDGSRWNTKLALAAATALLAFALVVSAAGTAALQTEPASSMGLIQLLRQKATSVYVSAQTLMNVLRVARFGAEALEANPAPDSLLEGLESEVQRCSDSPSEKPSAPATTQS